MIDTPEQVESFVNRELERMHVAGVKEFLRQHLIPPKLHYRKWDYSSEPISYPCWLVADLGQEDMGIVYSEYGHGKQDPWGAVHLSDEWFGTDDRWFLTLEDAVINSGCWDGQVPDGYEIS